MFSMDGIKDKISRGQYEFTRHAVDKLMVRGIEVMELREAIEAAEMIEDYPDDKYGPSCLLLRWTKRKRPLHIQCSYPYRPVVKIITVYEPDPTRSIDLRKRRYHNGKPVA